MDSLGGAGVTLFGVDVDDQSGHSVSGAGDVNGDGYEDLLIGASSSDAAGNGKTDAGETYVVFGSPTLASTIDLAMLGAAGVILHGAGVGDQSGHSVSSAGDINGDGFDDLVIGAHLADGSADGEPEAGETYVVFGDASLPPTIDLASLGDVGNPDPRFGRDGPQRILGRRRR